MASTSTAPVALECHWSWQVAPTTGGQAGPACAGSPSALGGEAKSPLTVAPGQVLQVMVGGMGGGGCSGSPFPGGFNGGNSGGGAAQFSIEAGPGGGVHRTCEQVRAGPS